MTSLYQALRQIWSFDQPLSGFWNDSLRIGALVFVLGFVFLSPLLVLLDRGAPARRETARGDLGSAGAPAWFAALLPAASLLLVALFPLVYRAGLHAVLIAAGFLLGLVAQRLNPKSGLRIRPPRALSVTEGVGLLGLCMMVVGLTFWAWNEIPVVLGQDEAMIAVAGRRFWSERQHPFVMTQVAMPGVHPSVTGFFLTWVHDPRLGQMIYPALCAALCPILMYRWCRLFAPRSFAWLATILFVTTPFFGYYSRVPNGSSLIFAQLTVLYGITRCLAVPGALGAVIGGVGMGIAHWDYPASRVLLLYAATVGVGMLPWRRQMAPGWWRRLVLLGAIAAPLVFAFPLIKDYPVRDWTSYMTHPGYRVENAEMLTGVASLLRRVEAHLRMPFDASANATGPITIPGTPLKPWPEGALLLLGLGAVAASVRRAPAALLFWALVTGLAGSLLSLGPPNGHRVMAAEVPAAVFMAAGLHLLWPRVGHGGLGVAYRVAALGVLAWSTCAALTFFHGEMWRGPAVSTDQIFHKAARGLRVRRDLGSHDVRVVSRPSPWDDLYLGPRVAELRSLHAANWLPPNWADRPTSVQSDLEGEDAIGLVRSVFPDGNREEVIDPAGSPAGWGYHTDGMTLGDREAQRQWTGAGRVSGSLMIARAGTLSISCPGARITLDTLPTPSSADSVGSFPVLQGLTWLTLSPLESGMALPREMALTLKSRGEPTETHELRPGQLYRIPVHGWLETRLSDDGGEPTRRRILPTLSGGLAAGDAISAPNGAVRTILSARLHLPPGKHPVRLFPGRSRRAQLWIGQRRLLALTAPYERIDFETEFDAVADDGQLVQIVEEDDEAADSVTLAVSAENRLEVPPYGWFSPAVPAAALLENSAGN